MNPDEQLFIFQGWCIVGSLESYAAAPILALAHGHM